MEQHTFNDRYKIIAKIGSGGMAEVFKAIDTVLDRPVAVKVLHKYFSEDEDFVSRFKREAQAAAGLNHPNIVNIYDWGSENGTYFIVMELLEGQSLKEYISLKGTLSPKEAMVITKKVLSALSFAHKHQIVHRDIKPHNIILTREGEVKVTDFGIARAGASTMTQTGTILGTAHYLSPEQARGQDVGVTSDIYSAGIVLYEMVTGKIPFVGDNPVAIALKHVHEYPTPPRDINPNIPEALQTIIQKAMAKNPESRYQSAADMRNDIMRLMEGMPITATAPEEQETMVMMTPDRTARVERPFFDEKPKRKSRSRGPLIAIFVILLLAAGGLFAFTSIINMKKVVEVPNVQGKTYSDAENILKNLGLKIKEGDRQYSNTVEPGLVISQDPSPGDKKDDGSVVYVTLSKGKSMKTIPDISGMRESQATSRLIKSGLDVGDTKYEYSDDVSEGLVIHTDPDVGKEIPEGTKVDLIVSKGQAVEQIPDVYGKSSAEAQGILKQAGFAFNTSEEFSDTASKNTVIRTSPASGTEVKKGSNVTLIVSKGPETISVPDVRGKLEDEAINILEAAGFTVSSQDSPGSALPENVDKVVSQNPNAGEQVKKSNANITIYIGKK